MAKIQTQTKSYAGECVEQEETWIDLGSANFNIHTSTLKVTVVASQKTEN